jgi:hypothetical protein
MSLLLRKVVCLAEKQQIHFLQILWFLVWHDRGSIYRIRGEHANHDTTDAVWLLFIMWFLIDFIMT